MIKIKRSTLSVSKEISPAGVVSSLSPFSNTRSHRILKEKPLRNALGKTLSRGLGTLSDQWESRLACNLLKCYRPKFINLTVSLLSKDCQRRTDRDFSSPPKSSKGINRPAEGHTFRQLLS